MTFRTKLLLLSAVTVSGAVALVTGAVSLGTRRTFDRMDQERRDALLARFRQELAVQGGEVAAGVQRVAASDNVLRVAIEANRAEPDFSPFVNEAAALAESTGLDYLDVLREDGSIISSAHWPARFGYKNDWLVGDEDRKTKDAFLTVVPTPDGNTVALASASPASAGSRKLHIVGARRLDAKFLSSLKAAPGTRALLWLSPREVFDAEGPVANAEKLSQLAEQAKQDGKQAAAVIQWTKDRASAEAFVAQPLAHGNRVLGVLMLGASLKEQVRLERSILWIGLLVGGSGILLGVLMGWWTTERVTRPVAKLASGARAVAAGEWETRVPVTSEDEIGELGRAFNQMTEQLIQQRDRAIQAERVAAWRELARRLAHELKNPLFPLQITVENLQKARLAHPDQFDEVFRESTTTLLAELTNLKTIIGRFSDFAKMPPPQLERVDVNAIVKSSMKLFEAQFQTEGRPAISPRVELPEAGLVIEADAEQVGRALRNLILNAMDAMPSGGVLHIRAERQGEGARILVSDTGEGLSQEECARLFTPYYTTKRHGTGLGLALVQSVVSDHRGRISVSSEPGRGTTFTIELPAGRDT
jgi:two-component system, NtrC family, nitrogen regulation sensor histidine kinase NtrY